MKTKKMLSFVVLAAFAALAQTAAARTLAYFYDGNTPYPTYDVTLSTATSNYTVTVGSDVPAYWDVTKAYNIKYPSCLNHIGRSSTDCCVEADSWSWSGTSELTVSARAGFEYLCLYCEPVAYSIAFDANGGEGEMDPLEDISYSDTETLPANEFERMGYDFAGWTTDAKNKNPDPPIADESPLSAVNSGVTRSTTNVTLYAKWTAHAYTITYDENGGTLGAEHPTSATYGTAFEVTTPTWLGYVFTGWALDGDYDETTACYGSSKNSCSTPFGYSDAGYVSSARASDKKSYLVNLASENDAAVTLTAQWRPLQINVVINTGDATNTTVVAYDSISDEDGQALEITTPERAGYVFRGWKVKGHDADTARYGFSEDSESCTTAFPSGTTAYFTADTFGGEFRNFYVTHLSLTDGKTVTFLADWRKIANYTIEYDENGGTAGSSRPTTGVYNKEVKISHPKMTGYTFAGWALAGDDSDLTTARYSTDGETYSKFENGVAKPAEDSAYSYIFVKNLASKEDDDGSGAGVTVTLVAQWTPNTANVVIEDDGTETTTALKYGTAHKIEVPQKDGATFLGWQTTGISTTTALCGESSYSCETPITDILDETNFIATAKSFYVKNLTPNDGATVTFSARWKTTYYNVSVNWNDGEHPTKKWIPNKVYDEQVVVQAPTRTGYTFAGWKISGDYDAEKIECTQNGVALGVTPEGSITEIKADGDLCFKNMATKDGAVVVLTAQWTVNSANVKVRLDADDAGTVYTNDYGTVFDLPPTNKTGYVFKGWDVEGYGDTALYGTDRDAINTKIASVNGAIRFADTNTTTYARNLTTTNNADVTFTPAWTTNEYTIIYDANGGTELDSWPTSAVFDGEKFLVTAPTKTDYTFDGWTVTGEYDPDTFYVESDSHEVYRIVDTAGGVTKIVAVGNLYFKNMASKNGAKVTLTARWKMASATVTIDGVAQTNSYDKVLAIEVPTKAGYTFDGWLVDGYDASTALYGSTTNIADMTAFPAGGSFPKDVGTIYVTHLSLTDGAVVTFTSQWKAINYKIEYDENGGTAGDEASRPANADYEVTFKVSRPERTGYSFVGWELTGKYDLETARSGSNGETKFSDAGMIDTTAKDAYFKNLASTTNATVKLVARWSPYTTTVTNVVNGTGTSKTATYDVPMLLAAPTPTGYLFHGWKVRDLNTASALYGYDVDSCTNSITKLMTNDTYIAVTSDIYVMNLREDAGKTVTFTADLEPVVYNVTYDDPSYVGDSYPTNATYDKAFFVAKPSKTGHEFTGWALSGAYESKTACWGSNRDCDSKFATSSSSVVAATDRDAYFMNLAAETNVTVKLSAQWDAYVTTVTIVINDAEATTNLDYDVTLKISVPPLSGYGFHGWTVKGYDPDSALYGFTKDGCTNAIPADGVIATTKAIYVKHLTEKRNEEVTFTANLTPSSYKIDYDLGEGGEPGAEHPTSMGYDDDAFLVSAPKRPGYAFAGWTIKGDYNPSKAMYGASQQNCTKTFPESGTVSTTGDIWFGWLATVDGVTVTLKAEWTPYTANVEIDNGDGTTPAQKTPKYDEALKIEAPGVEKGYAFKGWQVENFATNVACYGFGEKSCTNAIPEDGFISTSTDIWVMHLRTDDDSDEVVTFTAQLSPAEYTLVYHPNGGTLGASCPTNATFGESLFVSAPSLKGYTFLGWQVENYDAETACYGYETNVCETALADDMTGAGDLYLLNLATIQGAQVVLTATWNLSAPSYDVTYEENGGSGHDRPSEALKYGNAYLVSASARTGYEFTGWYVHGFDPETACYGDTKECVSTFPTDGKLGVTTDIYVKNLTMVGQAITFTAQWNAISYGLDYDEDGGTAGSLRPETAAYDSVVAIDPPTKADCRFAGWKVTGFSGTARYGLSEGSCTMEIGNNGEIRQSGTIYVKNLSAVAGETVQFTAIWENTSCAITYNLDGGSLADGATNPETVTYGTPVLIKAPTKANGTFIGWKVADCGDDARWGLDEKSCTDTIPEDGVIEVTGDIWIKNFVASSSSASATMTALWAAEQVTVSFDANGGTVSPTEKTYSVGSKYGTLPTPTTSDANKVFDGWWTASDGGTKVTVDTLAKKTVTTLYAHWKDMYVVVFNSNDGEGETTSQKIAIGVATALTPNTFTRKGYTFQGWAKSADAKAADYADGASVTDLSTTPGAEIDLYAVWKANTYVVKFFANGGYGTMESITATYDVPFELPANKFTPPANSTFVGWYRLGKTYEAKTTVVNLTTVADDVVTLSAKWSTTITELSKAMDCTNLSWDNLDSNASIQWIATNSTDALTDGTCACQQNGNLNNRSPMIAQLKASGVSSTVTGTLKFWWKPSSASAKLSWGTNKKRAYDADSMTEILAAGTDWQEVVLEIDSANAYYLIIDNFSDAATGTYEYIDQMSWTVPDVAVAPTTANAVKSLSMATAPAPSTATTPASSDAMTLSFTGDERFAYRVLYKDSLTDPEWSVLETVEVQVGTGEEQTFTVPRDESASRFYTIETIQK